MKRQKSTNRSGNAPRVYSYVRFSTPEQKLGDSLRRQVEKARQFAATHGLEFDEELRDEGLSAFTGENRTKGVLAEFVKRVKEGAIKPGSVLFVEDLDRITREGMFDALRTILFDLIEAGVSIATPEIHYTVDSLNAGAKWLLLAKIELAHQESRKKSDRLGAVWAEKKRRAREDGIPLTKRCPSWLKIEGGRYVPIPEAARAIQMIFREAPVLGQARLVKKLNSEATWSPPARTAAKTAAGWRKSYVRKILTNRAVIGEYQPFTTKGKNHRVPEGSAVPNYYPPVISREEFDACQIRFRERRKNIRGGRIGAARNIFSHLARCGYCGGPMYFRDRGKGSKGGCYLVCERKERGISCHAVGVRYSELEELILNNCPEISPARVLPSSDEARHRCDNLRMKIAAQLEKQHQLDGEIRSLLKQMKTNISQRMRERLTEEMNRTEQEIDTCKSSVEDARYALAQEERGLQSFKVWQNSLKELRAMVRKKTAIDARLRLRAQLSEFIQRIEVFGRGFRETVEDREDVAESELHNFECYGRYLEDLFDDQGGALKGGQRLSFIRYVLARRMSREGRFFRIYFLPKGEMDLPPDGSLASGWRFNGSSRTKWMMMRPDWTALLKDFLALRASKRSKGKSKLSPKQLPEK